MNVRLVAPDERFAENGPVSVVTLFSLHAGMITAFLALQRDAHGTAAAAQAGVSAIRLYRAQGRDRVISVVTFDSAACQRRFARSQACRALAAAIGPMLRDQDESLCDLDHDRDHADHWEQGSGDWPAALSLPAPDAP